MKLTRTCTLFPLIIFCLATAPMIRADSTMSLDLGGSATFVGHPGTYSTAVGCHASGASALSCSRNANVTTADGASATIGVSGTAMATYGSLSIFSQASASITNGNVNLVFLNDNNTVSYSEELMVQGLGQASGFLQFNASTDFRGLTTDFFGGSVVDTFFDGTSQMDVDVVKGDLPVTTGPFQVDLPVEFGVPFTLTVSLEMQGQGFSEDPLYSDSAFLNFSQPIVLDASGNPITATITSVPEVSSWWLLLTAALFIVPAVRQLGLRGETPKGRSCSGTSRI